MDVSRLAAMVRGGGPAKEGEEGGGGIDMFRFEKRHYRLLETLALPGVEDAPVRWRETSVFCSCMDQVYWAGLC